MTLLGKIFTMFIFIFSIAFMVLSVMVYRTEKNWRDYCLRTTATSTEPLGLKPQLDQAKAKNDEYETKLDTLKNQLQQERAARAYALAALEEQLQLATEKRKTAEEARDLLRVEAGEAVAAMKVAHGRLADLKGEIEKARADIKVAQAQRDEKQERAVFVTDKLQEAEDLRRRLEERQAELVAQIGRMQKVLRANGLGEFDDVDGIPPIGLTGLVLDVRKNFMEISIGSDDGLRVGHELDVFKDRTYKGRIVVRRTDPDRAVAEIITEIQRGEMIKGDRVRTRTKVG